MARRPSAGDLYELVAFDKREDANPDSPVDYGNTVADWQEQFTCRAAFVHLRGGETVLAARLEGRHSQVVRVRSSLLSRAVDTDWRLRDVRTGAVFNIRDITPTSDRMWIDILAERGVAV